MARSRCVLGVRCLVACSVVVYFVSVLHLATRLDTARNIEGFLARQGDNGSMRPGVYRLKDAEPPGDGAPWTRYYRANISRFGIDAVWLKSMDFPLKKYVSLDEKTVTDFVFVTAASNSFVLGALNGIASIQKYYPEKQILFYGLGLSGENKKKITPLCNVEYRDFNFSKYPRHVSKLKSYTWKPLIIYEVLTEYAGVFWIDSSVTLLSSNISATYPKLLATDGVLLFNFAGHNTFVVTHRTMFDYLPTNLTEMQRIYQYEANTMMIFGTRSIFEGVVRWWVLCALVERCMAPVYSVSCRKTPPDVYAGCHRYDQTAINILLANRFRFDYRAYAKHYDNLEVIRRHARRHGAIPKSCPVAKTGSR